MNKYKKFIITLSASFALFAILYICFVHFLIKFSSFELFSTKDALIWQSTKEPRIIIDSGSNSYHGINSLMIEKHFGKTTINLADSGAVSLEAKIYRIAKYANDGDIVILPLEYIYYTKQDEFDLFYDNMFFEFSHYYEHLPLYKKIDFILKTPFFSIVNTLIRNYQVDNFSWSRIKRIAKNKKNQPNITQNIENGERGDYVYVGKIPLSAKDMQFPCQEYIYTGKNDDTIFGISKEFLKILKLMKKVEKEKNIKFILTYPAVAGDDCYNTDTQYGKEFIKFLSEIEKVSKEYQIGFIGEYSDSYFPMEYLLNTWFHVTPPARDMRTKKLIENLEKFISQ